jgi:hypothetical protein
LATARLIDLQLLDAGYQRVTDFSLGVADGRPAVRSCGIGRVATLPRVDTVRNAGASGLGC